MKAPITGVEVRYRIAGADPDTAYTYRRFLPSDPIKIKGLLSGQQYDLGVRYLAKVPSKWTVLVHTVATTTREGTAALPPVTTGNVPGLWISGTEIDWSATDTVATVNVSPGTLQIGEQQRSYNASSVEITGTAEEEKTVYLYYDDPRGEGGTRTLGHTTDRVASSAGYGRILIDQVTVTFDVTGGTGTTGGGDIGGGGGGSGPRCPWEEAWMVRLDGPVAVGAVAVGDQVMLTDGRYAPVLRRRRRRSRLVRVVFAGGHSLTCSPTAQLERAGGGYLLPGGCIGSRLTYWRDEEHMSTVVERIEDAGTGWVIEFSVDGNSSFVVGDDPGHLLGHHNIKNDPLG